MYRVGKSKTSGLGLFATETIKRGTRIIEYIGPQYIESSLQDFEVRNLYVFRINDRIILDGSPRYNIARYANHSHEPTAKTEIIRGRVWLFAKKTIHPGEEITFNYGREYVRDYFGKNGCRCVKCRRKKR